ncbi:unnamed protein product, partial [Aphanomyces euteiches]
ARKEVKNKRVQTALDIEARTSGRRAAATVALLRSLHHYNESYNTLAVTLMRECLDLARKGVFIEPTYWRMLALVGHDYPMILSIFT